MNAPSASFGPSDSAENNRSQANARTRLAQHLEQGGTLQNVPPAILEHFSHMDEIIPKGRGGGPWVVVSGRVGKVIVRHDQIRDRSSSS